MRRALAFVVAAGLIAGSLALRDRIDDRSERKSTVVRLVCATELAAACDELENSRDIQVRTVVEPAGETAERLSKPGDVDLDGWLVMPPWPEAVDRSREARNLERLFGPTGEPVARSPLVIVVRGQREPALRAFCEGSPGWNCVGNAAPQQWGAIGGEDEWGRVRPWHADPQREAVGLLLVGQATAAYFAPTEVTAFELGDDGYLAWLGALERAVQRTDGSVTTMLTAPAQVDIVGTTEADAGPQIATAATPQKPVMLYPRPVATADVVLAPVAGSRVTRTLRNLVEGAGARALAETGWRVEREDPVAGIDAAIDLPATDGLPKSGLLDALREPLSEIR